MAKRYTRQEFLDRLWGGIKRGKPLVMTGAGNGIAAVISPQSRDRGRRTAAQRARPATASPMRRSASCRFSTLLAKHMRRCPEA